MNSLKRLVIGSLGLLFVAVVVGILTTGSVRADRPVSDVTVVNTAAQPVPVSYSNTRSTPLFVDAGDSARGAIGAQCHIAFYNGETSCTLATVPAGKVLVIETMTCGATVATGTAFTGILMNMAAPNISGSGFVNLNHIVGISRIATIGSNDYYNLTTPVRMYASGGFDVTLIANAAAGSHDAGCAISGHLVAQ